MRPPTAKMAGPLLIRHEKPSSGLARILRGCEEPVPSIGFKMQDARDGITWIS